MPYVTATATDPAGNTSGVSAERQASLEVPTQSVREVPGKALILGAADGDAIAIEDPDTGPLVPEWNLTLSVASGTLDLSGLAGLSGSGNGTGRLEYEGSLAAVNQALAGLTFTPAAGFHGDTTVNLAAQSIGANPVVAQLIVTDGIFVVTTTADSGPGSLRQAILIRTAPPGARTPLTLPSRAKGFRQSRR